MGNYLIVGKGGMISNAFLNAIERRDKSSFKVFSLATSGNLGLFEENLKDILGGKNISHVIYLSSYPKFGLSDSESVILIDKTLTYFTVLIDCVLKINKNICLILVSTASFNFLDEKVGSAYFAAKRCAEIILTTSRLENYKILKLFNVYGSSGSLVVDSLKTKFQNFSIPQVEVKGSPLVLRNFLLVDRLVNFVLDELDAIRDRIVYVSGPIELSIGELVSLFHLKYRKDYYFKYDESAKLDSLTVSLVPVNCLIIYIGEKNDLINYI